MDRECLWRRHIRDNQRLYLYELGYRTPWPSANYHYNKHSGELWREERSKFNRAYDKYLERRLANPS